MSIKKKKMICVRRKKHRAYQEYLTRVSNNFYFARFFKTILFSNIFFTSVLQFKCINFFYLYSLMVRNNTSSLLSETFKIVNHTTIGNTPIDISMIIFNDFFLVCKNIVFYNISLKDYPSIFINFFNEIVNHLPNYGL